MDEATAAMKVFACPEDTTDPPILWLGGRTPFVGACARKAAQDEEWAIRALESWWGAHDDHDVEPIPNHRFQRRSEGHYNSDKEEFLPWPDNWFCCGCGVKVKDHG